MAGVAFLPVGLARRFALAAAGLAAGALLLTSLASWWLINRQHQEALEQLAAKERQFHAAAVGSDLHALAARIAEVAESTILATGLVDSAGRETYLTPFLSGIRQINGVPIQLLFTDFEGKEIASNNGTAFTPGELQWLRKQLEVGGAGAMIDAAVNGAALLAMEPLTYARTKSPEGALLYKVALDDLHVGKNVRLEWGTKAVPGDAADPVTAVPVPRVFEGLQFRVRGPYTSMASATSLAPQYLAIFVIALVLFTVVVVAGVRLAKLLTRDLQRLEAFSSRFLSSGLSSERALTVGSTEVASLAGSINKMLDRLHEQHSALLHEREKLTELADALQTADRRKDEFLAMLAHELRNPLAPIKNSVMVMRAKPLVDPELAWARDVVDRQVDQMSRLLDDLLDVSRITRNKLELRKQHVQLTQLLDAAVETSRPVIKAAAHELVIELPPHPVYLNVDPVRVAQIFANLLNNAAKYTGHGGRIVLSATYEKGEVVVSVKDNGIGISQEQLAHVFEMFRQAESLQQAQGGLGIGLSIVRGLVEVHGGSVSARSDGPNRGSEFIVRLPAAQIAPEDTVARQSQGQGAGEPRRILVADDNHDAADTLAMMLGIFGHEVRTAHDGVEALEMAAEFRPDVVFLDIGMPHLDGYQTAVRMRAEPWGKHVMLIALTGWGQEDDKRRAAEAGFDHHLVKPADPAVLEKLLAQSTTHQAP